MTCTGKDSIHVDVEAINGCHSFQQLALGGRCERGGGLIQGARPVRVILAGPSLARGRHLLPPFRDRTARLAACQPYGQRYRACKAYQRFQSHLIDLSGLDFSVRICAQSLAGNVFCVDYPVSSASYPKFRISQFVPSAQRPLMSIGLPGVRPVRPTWPALARPPLPSTAAPGLASALAGACGPSAGGTG